VLHVIQYLNPGRVWHDISSRQTGGYCEPRLNVNRPTPRCRCDAGHTVFIPPDMSIWGYSDSIKSTRDLRLHFDLDTLPKLFGEDLSYSKPTSPILMLYDERVTNCAALLAEECISSLPENRMYGESLTMALMAALFASRGASNRAVNSGLARWQLRRVWNFSKHISLRILAWTNSPNW
jgi:AraC family transcriptional regulator